MEGEMAMKADRQPAFGWLREITRYQWTVFLVCWLGWTLDTCDFGLFSLVLRPALTDLLGGHPDMAEIGRIGGLIGTVGLLGWAIGGFVFGVLANYIGRVRTLTISILLFSVFTGCQGLVEAPWQLGLFRFLAGVGTGAEMVVGIPLLVEAFEHVHRAKIAGILMTGGGIGGVISAAVYGQVAHYGWRWVFVTGILPALLLFAIRRNMVEPERFAAVQVRREALRSARSASVDDREFLRFVPLQMFSRQQWYNTTVGLLFAIGTLLSLWTTSIWLPTIQSIMLQRDGITGVAAIAQVSHGQMLFYTGGIIGQVAFGFIADAIGRRLTITLYSLVTLIVGLTLYLGVGHYAPYPYLLPVLGFSLLGISAAHAVYLPELFPTQMRATGVSFCNGTGRVITSIGPFVAGLLVAELGGNFTTAAGIMTCWTLLTIVAMGMSRETRGAALPA
jgi:MFS family permease